MNGSDIEIAKKEFFRPGMVLQVAVIPVCEAMAGGTWSSEKSKQDLVLYLATYVMWSDSKAKWFTKLRVL